MYTLEQLQQKTLKELKEIGWCLNVLPAGDRRCRQNWIDALVGTNLPLLKLLETSPGVEVDQVFEAIAQVVETSSGVEVDQVSEAIAQVVETSPVVEVDQVSEAIVQVAETSPGVEADQVQQAIEVQVQEPIESKFGRIVYPKAAAEPIAPAAKNLTPKGINETKPDTDRTESVDLHHRRFPSTQPSRNSSGIETETLASQKGDRVLAVPGDSQADRLRVLLHQSIELTATIFNDEQSPNRGDGQRRVESEVKVSQSAIAPNAKISVGVEVDCPLEPMKTLPGVTFSPRFLFLYSLPQSENIFYKADADGQLSLLDFEVQSELEPPDPDDFQFLDDFRKAIALWDAEHPELLEVGLDSFRQWALCFDVLPEQSEVLELSLPIFFEGCANKISSTYNFSISTFDVWCDRTNRNSDSDEPFDIGNFVRLPNPKPPSFPPMVGAFVDCINDNFSDEPPIVGVGARRPKPKPPSFSLMVVAAGDRSSIKRFVHSAIVLSARAPPGGDVVN